MSKDTNTTKNFDAAATNPNLTPPRRWRREFPYHWEADELVSRRELLRFTIITSGALFGGTTLLAVLNALSQHRRGQPRQIATLAQVPEGSAFYFNYPEPDDQAVLLHLPGGELVAYSQKCTHLSCSVYYSDTSKELICPCHDGIFDAKTGEPVAGPPQRRLPRVVLRREANNIIAVEEVP
jgi:nitrite reductase/ring-hydroxylating ferredoxin subunit